MTAKLRLASRVAAILALALGLWGWLTWPLAAQTAPTEKLAAGAETDRVEERVPGCTSWDLREIAALVNDEPITCYEVEHRARLQVLTLGFFAQYVKTRPLRRSLEHDFRTDTLDLDARLDAARKYLTLKKTHGSPVAAQSRVYEAQVASRRQALAELIDDRLKLQAAKRHGIEVSDDEVRRLLGSVAERHNMTLEKFTQNLKKLDIDSASMGERLRAQEAWKSLVAKLARDFADQLDRGTTPEAPQAKP